MSINSTIAVLNQTLETIKKQNSNTPEENGVIEQLEGMITTLKGKPLAPPPAKPNPAHQGHADQAQQASNVMPPGTIQYDPANGPRSSPNVKIDQGHQLKIPKESGK